MEHTVRTRLGDGSLVEMTPSEIRADLEDGTQQAAKRSKLPVLGEAELDHLHDIFCSNARFSAVDIGNEVVLSFDGSGNADVGSRLEEMLVYQNHHGADLTELWNIDYSYKAIKTILSFEANLMKQCQLNLVAPCQYGAMPDLGRYSHARRPGAELVGADAARQDRRGARRPGGGRRARHARHAVRRRRAWPRPAPTAWTSTPPAPPATATSSRRCARSRRSVAATPT